MPAYHLSYPPRSVILPPVDDFTIKRVEPNDLLKDMIQRYKYEFRPPNPNSILQDFSFDFSLPTRPRISAEARRLATRWSPWLARWTNAVQNYVGPPRWQLDLDGLAVALDHLGITWDVEITPIARWYGLCAIHGSIPDEYGGLDLPITDQVHVITVNPGLSPVAASMTLWHELTHAKQQQECDSPADWYAEQSRLMMERGQTYNMDCDSYFDFWFEKEAFRNMDLHFEVGQVAKPA